MTTITIQTEFYNEKRYGKPYIAICDEKLNVLSWGTWLGTPGNAGELTLNLSEKPTIVMQGQKDFRVPRNSAPEYALFSGGERITDWTKDKLTAVKFLRGSQKSDL